MKVKVNRQLSAGQYHVNFEVAGFTTDELSKMSSFGIPLINLRWGAGNAVTKGRIALNKIVSGYDMAFPREEDAREYETQVLAEIKAAMEQLRASKDVFTASDEVEL